MSALGHQDRTTASPGGTRHETVLVLSQVYVPDPAANGQYLHDAARELAARGHRVIVLTANRGYDDPRMTYARRELLDGVEIRRVPWSSFGKRSLVIRAAAMLVFMLHCVAASVFMPSVTAILVVTSPPLCGFAAALGAMIRRRSLTYWVMDLNPDQLIALGRMKAGSWAARVLDALQRFVLRRARHIVALDRFMADRLLAKFSPAEAGVIASRLAILPPWPQEELEPVPHESNPFRVRHGLEDRFVVMYSGNHGYSTPVTTLLDAALEIDSSSDPADRRILFLFVGGGVGKREVDEVVVQRRPANVMSLPYQPRSELAQSLSAADVQVVTVGDGLVGVVHPCKVYGAMKVGRPILLIAPDPCHASELVVGQGVGWHVQQGDVRGAVRAIREAAALSAEVRASLGRRAREFVERSMEPRALRGKFCDMVVDTADSPVAVASGGRLE